MSTITTFRGLIGALGGAAHAAALTGLPRRSIQAMVERDSIAADHWPAFVEAAKASGFTVSLAELAAWRAANRAARRADTQILALEHVPHHETVEERVA